MNAKLALVDAVSPLGPDVIEGAAGGVVSISQVHEAGALVPVLDPETPTASTSKVCEPAARPEYDFGLVHAVYVTVGASLHTNVALLAFVVNENDAVVWFVGFAGFAVIVGIAGATTDHV